tara:strand:+ start:40722 stop:41798 length:1077 start_codon:yes stop_codon:yes gene_type:complete
VFKIFKKKTKNFVASQNEISRIKIPQYLINNVGIFYGKFKSDFIYTGFYAYKNNISQKEKIVSSFDKQTQEIYLIFPIGCEEIAIRNSSQKGYYENNFELINHKFYTTDEFYKKFFKKEKKTNSLLHSFPRTGNNTIRKYFNNNEIGLLQSHFVHTKTMSLKSKFDQEILVDDLEVLGLIRNSNQNFNVLIGIRKPIEVILSYLKKRRNIIEPQLDLIDDNWRKDENSTLDAIKKYLLENLIPIYNSWWENDFFELYKINFVNFKKKITFHKFYSFYKQDTFNFYFYKLDKVNNFVKEYFDINYNLKINDKIIENSSQNDFGYPNLKNLDSQKYSEIFKIVDKSLSDKTRNVLNIFYK